MVSFVLVVAALQAASSGSDVKAGVDAWARGDHAAAVAAWRALSDGGDPHAQFNLAQAYKLGRGVPADMGQAIDLYRRAAAQGHAEAGSLLGLMLFQAGRRQEAMPYVVQAAHAGEPGAQYVYGTALFNGDMVRQDSALAYAMMSRAAAGGIPPAVTRLAELDRLVQPVERQRGLALAKALASAGTIAVGPNIMVPAHGVAAPAPARVTDVRLATAPPRPALPAIAGVSTAPATDPLASRWRVQLGAFGQPANANALFTRLQGSVGALRDAQPFLVRAEAVTRLQAGPFPGKAAAETACRAVQAAGQACFAVAP